MANRNPKLVNLEAGESEQAQPAIPPGVQADVTVKYKTPVDPNQDGRPRARSFNEELADLAELTEDEDTARPAQLPFDPVTQFCAEWRNFAGYQLKVTRLPDPATRRMAGQSYNRPCLEIESLGALPFDPANLEGLLQIINNGSGGVFRIWLVDEAGAPVPDAFLDRVAIGDPPKRFQFNGAQENENPYYRQALPREQLITPLPPQKSDTERELDEIKSDLFRQVLQRAINPPPVVPPVVTDATAGMSEDDRLTLLLVKQGALLPSIVEKITTLAGAPDHVAKETWQERAINAGLHIAQNNPQLIERVSNTIYAIVDRILPNTRTPISVAQNLQNQQPQPVQHPPGQRANTPIAAAPIPRPSNFTPDGPNVDAPDDDEESDPDVMDILDGMFELLTDTRPFTTDDPVIQELGQKYPIKFTAAMRLIATTPVDSIVEWISSQSSLYAALLSGVGGAHYRARLLELQTFCKAPPAPPPAPEMIDVNTLASETDAAEETSESAS